MSMSFSNLDALISRFPLERESLGRLQSFLHSVSGAPEYTFEHLYHNLAFRSPEVLALVLADLARAGVVAKTVRIESPRDRGGIADFSSLSQVPTEIDDWRTGQRLRVQPENLQVLFKFQGASSR